MILDVTISALNILWKNDYVMLNAPWEGNQISDHKTFYHIKN